MVEEIQRNFKLGGHKAAAISMILQDADIFMVSDLPDDLVRQIHFIPFASLQEALDEALRKMGKDAKVLVLPAAGSTLPML
jgi:nickel-dependent lactate racemase